MNRSQIHITTFLWVGISVKTKTFFAFLEKHLPYHQESIRVPPMVRVPQVGNPWSKFSFRIPLLSKSLWLSSSFSIAIALFFSQKGLEFGAFTIQKRFRSRLILAVCSALHQLQTTNINLF